MESALAMKIRPVRASDARAIASIDAAHTGVRKSAWWTAVVGRHVRGGKAARVGLVATEGARETVIGYLLGQVRAFEFGSEPCGWIFAVGVRPDRLRAGVAGALLDDSRRRFEALDVRLLRTMVRSDDVPVLTFFRSRGFEAGPYAELELQLPGAPP